MTIALFKPHCSRLTGLSRAGGVTFVWTRFADCCSTPERGVGLSSSPNSTPGSLSVLWGKVWIEYLGFFFPVFPLCNMCLCWHLWLGDRCQLTAWFQRIAFAETKMMPLILLPAFLLHTVITDDVMMIWIVNSWGHEFLIDIATPTTRSAFGLNKYF